MFFADFSYDLADFEVLGFVFVFSACFSSDISVWTSRANLSEVIWSCFTAAFPPRLVDVISSDKSQADKECPRRKLVEIHVAVAQK